jgi:hypothetical protein
MEGEFVILDATGHKTLRWDDQDEVSVQEVRKQFEELIARNYLLYSVDRSGHGTQLEAFDDVLASERVIAHAPLVGG